jgi:hypothetical protein
MKYIIIINILLLGNSCLNKQIAVESAVNFFSTELLYSKNLCIKDTSDDIDYLSIRLQVYFNDYCNNGFLYGKTIYSDFLVSEYSVPYKHIGLDEYLSEEEIIEMDDLWSYYNSHRKNESSYKLKVNYSSIKKCSKEYFFSKINSNDNLFLKIKKPLLTKDYILVELELLQDIDHRFIRIWIFLNYDYEGIGWYFEK